MNHEPTNDTQQQLALAALQVRNKSYSPYSKFAVGAAILAEDGQTFVGCNVENASFGLTICAERVAACNAIAQGSHNFRSIAIVSRGAVSACGACRQFLHEFSPDLEVIVADSESGEIVSVTTLADLLPNSFGDFQ